MTFDDIKRICEELADRADTGSGDSYENGYVQACCDVETAAKAKADAEVAL